MDKGLKIAIRAAGSKTDLARGLGVTLGAVSQWKRVPVLRDGRVVGIVSRANLVQALASAPEVPPAGPPASDHEIRTRLLDELAKQSWAGAAAGNVVVRDGVVHLWGFVWSPAESEAMRVAAENIPGVKSVEDHTAGFPVVAAM